MPGKFYAAESNCQPSEIKSGAEATAVQTLRDYPRNETARSVWTACGSPPLANAVEQPLNQ